VTRREFLAAGACASGSALLTGCATWGDDGCERPLARLGIISDTHVTDAASAERLKPALDFFRRAGVDAVLHCGDVTNLGYRREREAFERVWADVMPASTPLVSVLGNRDLSDTGKMSAEVRARDADLLLATSPVGKGAGVRAHAVCGIPVITLDWGHEDELEPFMSVHPELRRADRPLIVLQHRHMAETVYAAASDSWMADSGKGACYLKMFPKAISLSGHSHIRFAEPNGIWHGDFTAASAGSWYLGPADASGGREVSLLELYSDRFALLRRDLATGYAERHVFSHARAASDSRADGEFVFAQWNLGHFAHGKATATAISAADGARRAGLYRELIARVRPDVLGLCEYSAAFDRGGADARTVLFGDYPAFAAGPADGFQCNALVARSPLGETRFVPYSKRVQPTYYAMTETTLGGEALTVVETHLDLARAERTQQIAELVAALAGRPRVILSGDFNVDELAEFGPLRKAGLTPANGGDFGRFNTHRRRKMAITPAIDNVLVRGLTIRGVETADDALELSDHRMLVVRLSLA